MRGGHREKDSGSKTGRIRGSKKTGMANSFSWAFLTWPCSLFAPAFPPLPFLAHGDSFLSLSQVNSNDNKVEMEN